MGEERNNMNQSFALSLLFICTLSICFLQIHTFPLYFQIQCLNQKKKTLQQRNINLFDRRRRRNQDDDYDPFKDFDDEDDDSKEDQKPKPRSRISRIRLLTGKPAALLTPLSRDEQGIEQKPHFYSRKSLKEVGVNDKMTNVLQTLNILKPSKVQALSFSTIYEGKSCIIGDQTGSGKTLAYLVPIIQRMDELYAARNLTRPKERSPYIIIMTPTTELADQVSTVVKTLGNAYKFRTSCFTSISDFDSEQKKLRLGTEILITTPGRLFELLKKQEISLKELQVMILDEVDILFLDKSFPLQPIGQECPETTQFIFTSATLPEEVTKQILAEFPKVVTLNGPGLHRISPNIQEVLIDCSGDSTQARTSTDVLENKREALIQSLDNDLSERTLIFCNTIEQCRKVENFLQREDRHGKLRDIYVYHSAIEYKTRENNLFLFSKPLLKKPSILICTDRASRGLDFNRAFVDHVVLFDFPREPSEYLRRVGRTGRAGRPGKVTVLVYGKQTQAAKMVIQASIEGKQIDPSLVDPKQDEKDDDEFVQQELRRLKNRIDPLKPERKNHKPKGNVTQASRKR